MGVYKSVDNLLHIVLLPLNYFKHKYEKRLAVLNDYTILYILMFGFKITFCLNLIQKLVPMSI